MEFRKKLFFVLSVLLLSFLLVFSYAFFFEPYWIEKDSFEFNAGLSNPVKFVLISDFHAENENYVKEIVREVNSIDADFILIAGDFLSGLTEKEKTLSILPLLKFNKPAFAVLGNHDYWMSFYSDEPDFILADKTEKQLEENKINVLRNELIELNSVNPEFKGIFLAGIDDLWAGNANPEIIENVNGFTIVLAHEPETIELINRNKIESIEGNVPESIKENPKIFGVAGHTHGGQAFPLTLKMKSGIQKAKIPYYVSRGLGTSTLNVRFLCRPEITVIELK